jgi:hypothetical protein
MAEAADGGLVMEATDHAPDVQCEGTNRDKISWYEKYFKDSYATAGKNMKSVMASLRNGLQGQERFFLPVSRTRHFSCFLLLF